MRSTRESRRQRRHLRHRMKIAGTPERPRLAIRRTARHLYAQIIDDRAGVTVAMATTDSKDLTPGAGKNGANLAGAKRVGAAIAAKAKEKGVTRVVYDTGGHVYHGVVKALADAARENGLDF